jgi:hypothetical protein
MLLQSKWSLIAEGSYDRIAVISATCHDDAKAKVGQMFARASPADDLMRGSTQPPALVPVDGCHRRSWDTELPGIDECPAGNGAEDD